MQHDFGYSEETTSNQVSDHTVWLRLVRYLKPHAKPVTGAVILSLFISAISLALPYVLKTAIDSAIVNRDLADPLRFTVLNRLALFFLLLIILEFGANFLQVMLLEWTGQHTMHALRQDLFRHLVGLDLAFFNNQSVGRLVTRLTNDIQNMHEMYTSVIITVFNDFVRIVGIFGILFWLDWRLALVMSIFIPIIVGNTIWFSRLARDVFREIRVRLAKVNGFLQEMLSGMSIVQIFGRQKRTEHDYTHLNQEYYDSTLRQITIFGIFMPLIEVLATISIALIIWHGGGTVIKQQITIGELVAFLSYMRLFFQPVRELSQKYSIVQSAMASAERIFQLMDSHSSLTAPNTPIVPQEIRGRIDFETVSFGYNLDKKILHAISLSVTPGETLAVVGPTGSGKTTLINLLERFYDPDQGTILLDGHDLRLLDPGWLRSRIGLVMQDVFVIPDTIRKNICLDLDLSDEQLATVIEGAQLTELVGSLSEGVDTIIGEGGRELSSGQKQLLSFARVLAGNPRILILDEATSNVDSNTEMLVEKALAKILTGRTSIVIAHRLSTIQRANRIIVMEHGRIAQQGSHTELMAKGGLYHHLSTMQSGWAVTKGEKS